MIVQNVGKDIKVVMAKYPSPPESSPVKVKVNVKCTLVQALRLCTGRAAHRESRGIALLFLDHGTRRGEGSASRPGRSLSPGKTPYPLYRGLGGPRGRSGQVRKISPRTGIRSPDRPARIQSLYRLSYRARIFLCINYEFVCVMNEKTFSIFKDKRCHKLAIHLSVDSKVTYEHRRFLSANV